MKITLENTARVVNANGVDCRVWEGTTASGIKVQALIAAIAARDDEDLTEFETELQELHPASEVQAFPLRMIL